MCEKISQDLTKMERLHIAVAGLQVSWASAKKGPIWGAGRAHPMRPRLLHLTVGESLSSRQLKTQLLSLQRERCYHVLHAVKEMRTNLHPSGGTAPPSFL